MSGNDWRKSFWTSAFAGTKRQTVQSARHPAECSKGWRLRQETNEPCSCSKPPFEVILAAVMMTRTRSDFWHYDCIAVLVYKCPAMASSCGRCRSIEAAFNCGWCLSTSTCTVQSQCVSSANGSAGWLHRRQACHDPAITYVR